MKFANFVYFCILCAGKCNHTSSSDYTFPRIQEYKRTQNSQTSQDYIFHILQCFATKLDSFTKFRMLASAVLMIFLIQKDRPYVNEIVRWAGPFFIVVVLVAKVLM